MKLIIRFYLELTLLTRLWKEKHPSDKLPWKDNCVVIDTEEMIIELGIGVANLAGESKKSAKFIQDAKTQCADGKFVKNFLSPPQTDEER